MKIFTTGVWAVACSAVFSLLGAAPASAVTITQAFCAAGSNPGGESSSCLEGLGGALRITDEGAGLDPTDPNDFYVLLAVSTLASDGFDTTTYTGIDGVQFDTPFKTTDYEVFPTLSTAGVDGGAWIVSFGNLPENCSPGTFHREDKSVCSTGLTDTGDIDIWAFQINLLDTIVNPFTAGGDLNMRVSFFPTHNLSPNSANLGPETPTPFDTPPDISVAEPSSLVLLGTGLLWSARRMGCQRK